MPRAVGPVLLLAIISGGLTPPGSPGRTLVADAPGSPPAAEEPPLPAVPREFRAAWVATVSNIDWPSKPGLPAERQKAELVAILDKAQSLNLNGVILQVRPMADALYPSRLEPWSEFLTGQAGKAADWDPLAFAVAEAHKRGLELHAWFNPYRARHPSAKTDLPADHLVKRRPDLAKEYGKHSWLNPTSKEVQDHSLAVFLDVVNRYDVDGVHIDDYFYPYPEAGPDGKEIPFPDDDTWEAYRKAGGRLARDDWRRDAVNTFVRRMYEEVKKAKPWVKVGISPFGIWKPGHPPGIEGFNQHDKLYADAKLWLNEGWCDYWTPQLYWPIRQEKQSYPKLLDWWARENTKNRHLWPGLYTGRVTGKEKGWPAAEIGEQIALTRNHPGATGHVHFSMRALMNNPGGVADELKKVYAEKALVPASPWLGDGKPGKPTVSLDGQAVGLRVAIKPGDGEPARQFVVHVLTGGKWAKEVLPAAAGGETVTLAPAGAAAVAVTAVSRTGIEGEPARVRP
jgi:uncharacterized lipoprotein YddW (UPF0748 family)